MLDNKIGRLYRQTKSANFIDPPLPLEIGPQTQLGGLGKRCKLP